MQLFYLSLLGSVIKLTEPALYFWISDKTSITLLYIEFWSALTNISIDLFNFARPGDINICAAISTDEPINYSTNNW